jgi:glycosyltransferase involved in cell wall biosynthesis
VHVVVPDGIDDPRRPTGGNIYDRRVCDGLRARGWTVHENPVGRWPSGDLAAHDRLAGVMAGVPDGGTVLVDGLVGSAAPSQVAAAARRLRVVLLVHLPLGVRGDDAARAAERAALRCAAALVVPSRWTRSWLLDRYGLSDASVHVAVPGVAAAPLATGTAGGGRLLCVAAVTPLKGHDLLVAALASVADLPWRCTCVGSLDVDPGFARAVQDQAGAAGLADRVAFPGPRADDDLGRTYADADLLVLGSRIESWGIVAAEALARGLPVLGPDVGGLPEALGAATDRRVPGLLVPPEDAAALGVGLRRWLTDVPVRQAWRTAARERRAGLPTWEDTVQRVASVLHNPDGARVKG